MRFAVGQGVRIVHFAVPFFFVLRLTEILGIGIETGGIEIFDDDDDDDDDDGMFEE